MATLFFNLKLLWTCLYSCRQSCYGGGAPRRLHLLGFTKAQSATTGLATAIRLRRNHTLQLLGFA
jgi:hypothetical protein